VQHRDPHAHTGIEMELLTSVGEQLGCLLMLSQIEMLSQIDKAANERVDLVRANG
jgi:hypothetical protein